MSVRVLELRLHGVLIGHLTGFSNGRNVLNIADSFRQNPERPTFSLTTHAKFPRAEHAMSQPWARNQRLHPILSNLLPEGALRELIARRLTTHVDNEFDLISYLGSDLPGAIEATPLLPDEVPGYIVKSHGGEIVVAPTRSIEDNKFSLAGVQMKFSMKETDGRYNLPGVNVLGDWIVKTPSTKHPFVPLNEFTAMSLAEIAGVDIPPIKLVTMDSLRDLPPVNLPNETVAFAIKRFDRQRDRRIHMEDFAQVLIKYPHQKYDGANYETIGRVVSQYSGAGLADGQQMARRLLVNILLANGDAHLKNWSLIYPDNLTARLSPAYDILTTSVYIENESRYALNMGKTKAWRTVNLGHFQWWAEKSGLPWRAIKPHLEDTIEKARQQWPGALRDLPMVEPHKVALRSHWATLHNDFRI